MKRGAKLVLASYLGRPKGKADPALSLKPVVERLSTLLSRQVAFAEDCVGPRAEEKVAHLENGEALLLENLRFHAEEEKNDAAFARALAGLGDIYVNDAFGSSHRAHASVVGMVSHFDQKRAGFPMQKEVEALSRLRDDPEKICADSWGWRHGSSSDAGEISSKDLTMSQREAVLRWNFSKTEICRAWRRYETPDELLINY